MCMGKSGRELSYSLEWLWPYVLNIARCGVKLVKYFQILEIISSSLDHGKEFAEIDKS